MTWHCSPTLSLEHWSLESTGYVLGTVYRGSSGWIASKGGRCAIERTREDGMKRVEEWSK